MDRHLGHGEKAPDHQRRQLHVQRRTGSTAATISTPASSPKPSASAPSAARHPPKNETSAFSSSSPALLAAVVPAARADHRRHQHQAALSHPARARSSPPSPSPIRPGATSPSPTPAQGQWFSFQITGEGDHFIPPRDLDYHIPTARHQRRRDRSSAPSTSANSTTSATSASTASGRIFTSPAWTNSSAPNPRTSRSPKAAHVAANCGRTQQGMKNGGETHVFTVLAHQRGEQNDALRPRRGPGSTAPSSAPVPLGRMLDGVAAPDAVRQREQSLHPPAHRPAHLCPDKDQRRTANSRARPTTPRPRPALPCARLADGTLQIIGGHREAPIAQNHRRTPAAAQALRPPAGLPEKLTPRPPRMHLPKRPRRLRTSPALRALVRETALSAGRLHPPAFRPRKNHRAAYPSPACPGCFSSPRKRLVAEAARRVCRRRPRRPALRHPRGQRRTRLASLRRGRHRPARRPRAEERRARSCSSSPTSASANS